jgi:hypothetical protein
MTDGGGFTGNSLNTITILQSKLTAETAGNTMTSAKVFGRRDRAMIWAAKATLLVTAVARFSAIGLRAGSKRLGQMLWQL